MKKFGAIILVLALVLAMFPMTALAATGDWIVNGGNASGVSVNETGASGEPGVVNITLSGNIDPATVALLSHAEIGDFPAIISGAGRTYTDNALVGRFTIPALNSSTIASYLTTKASDMSVADTNYLTIVHNNPAHSKLYPSDQFISGDVKTKSYGTLAALSDFGTGGDFGFLVGPNGGTITLEFWAAAVATTISANNLNTSTDTKLLTITINTSGLSFARITPNISTLNDIDLNNNHAAVNLAPTATYTARLSGGDVPNTPVPGAWSWRSTEYSDSGANITSLNSYINSMRDDYDRIALTFTPTDTAAFETATRRFDVEIGNPSYYYGTGGGNLSNTITLTPSSSTYNGYGDLTLRSSGFYNHFQSLSLNGTRLTQGTDYTVENISGAAQFTVFESALRGIGSSARFTAAFSSGSASTTVTIGTYIPDPVINPPKTGDASSLMGIGLIFMACALAVTVRKVRVRAK